MISMWLLKECVRQIHVYRYGIFSKKSLSGKVKVRDGECLTLVFLEAKTERGSLVLLGGFTPRKQGGREWGRVRTSQAKGWS